MSSHIAEQVAESIMYEGYMLYPYRPSALKNRFRWTFGVVPPQPDDVMQTECLVAGDSHTLIDVKMCFLQVVARNVAELRDEFEFRPVDSLQVADQSYYTWQEAVERQVTARVNLTQILHQSYRQTFHFPSNRESTMLSDREGKAVGRVVREQRRIEGELAASAQRCSDQHFKVTVRIRNLSANGQNGANGRDEQILRSLVSTHTILGIRDGEFVSLLDPPAALVAAAKECQNIGTWPVLVGEPGTRDGMLSSPIILYDYPRIAPESPGDLFDATEIDELLALRVNTLTEEEKQEARAADPRVRDLLGRTDSLGAEHFRSLHGAIEFQPGDRVRLRPRGRADAFDLLLKGKTAQVESVERTLDGDDYLAVTVEEDPGRDLGAARMIGHRFFFRPEEVERLS